MMKKVVKVGEQRKLHLMQHVSTNYRAWRDDALDRYITTPNAHDSMYERIVGAVGMGISTILELPDYIVAGIVDKHIQGERSNTLRDIGTVLGDALHLRPLKTLVDMARIPGSMLRDTIVTIGGLQGSTRNTINNVLATG